MFQILLTPAAGKRLIAKAVCVRNDIQDALKNHTLVIVAGSTNGYVAEEILKVTGRNTEFNRGRFFRGVTLPPTNKTTDTGRLPDESGFPGDVVMVKGEWRKGTTVFDVVDSLRSGDVIVKGANCIDSNHKRAGILIGDPQGGTIAAILRAVIGKRTGLVIPAGLEKRVYGDLDAITKMLNNPFSTGPRMMPVTGDLVTEIEAVKLLFGVNATLVAAGGVCGAEGAVWIAVDGEPDKLDVAKKALSEIKKEEPFQIV